MPMSTAKYFTFKEKTHKCRVTLYDVYNQVQGGGEL